MSSFWPENVPTLPMADLICVGEKATAYISLLLSPAYIARCMMTPSYPLDSNFALLSLAYAAGEVMDSGVSEKFDRTNVLNSS